MKWLAAILVAAVAGTGIYLETRPTPCEELAQVCKEGNQALNARIMGLCSFAWMTMASKDQRECEAAVQVIRGE
jgi:hypothetical protein